MNTIKDRKCSTREIVFSMAKSPLNFHLWEKLQYSLCHDSLWVVIEEVCGKTLGE